MSKRIKTLIMGAAGRDFHNFNMVYRDNPKYQVVAFTASQIPEIEKRKYPKELAGKLYPNGIPIYPESMLPELIKKFDIDEVVLAYSDLTERDLINKISTVLAAGANFKLIGPRDTMIKSKKKLIAVCATRTGSGKGTVCRKIIDILKERNKKVVVIRHPMPYSKNLLSQEVQRFSSFEDLEKYDTTFEEQEEYVPYLERGVTVYSGIDYKKVIRMAEKDADIIVFESGNNDISLFKPDLYITVADPTRPDGIYSYPGGVNVRLADVIIINKVNLVDSSVVKKFEEEIKKINPKAKIIKAKSVIKVDKPELIKGKKVVLVDDAPTVTHGGSTISAAYSAAIEYGAKEIVDPKIYAVGFMKKVFKEYTHLKTIPTMGYSEKEKEDFIKTINNVKCDTIVFASYAYIKNIKFNKPIVRVTYELMPLDAEFEKIILRFTK
ncbi:MAG: GTP-binding protein [Candidatus Aenigmarchaeota archaeon]|nr:GTP-binding protein [Candidatus Aenigmarchaeota archaeon]